MSLFLRNFTRLKRIYSPLMQKHAFNHWRRSITPMFSYIPLLQHGFKPLTYTYNTGTNALVMSFSTYTSYQQKLHIDESIWYMIHHTTNDYLRITRDSGHSELADLGKGAVDSIKIALKAIDNKPSSYIKSFHGTLLDHTARRKLINFNSHIHKYIDTQGDKLSEYDRKILSNIHNKVNAIFDRYESFLEGNTTIREVPISEIQERAEQLKDTIPILSELDRYITRSLPKNKHWLLVKPSELNTCSKRPFSTTSKLDLTSSDDLKKDLEDLISNHVPNIAEIHKRLGEQACDYYSDISKLVELSNAVGKDKASVRNSSLMYSAGDKANNISTITWDLIKNNHINDEEWPKLKKFYLQAYKIAEGVEKRLEFTSVSSIRLNLMAGKWLIDNPSSQEPVARTPSEIQALQILSNKLLEPSSIRKLEMCDSWKVCSKVARQCIDLIRKIDKEMEK